MPDAFDRLAAASSSAVRSRPPVTRAGTALPAHHTSAIRRTIPTDDAIDSSRPVPGPARAPGRRCAGPAITRLSTVRRLPCSIPHFLTRRRPDDLIICGRQARVLCPPSDAVTSTRDVVSRLSHHRGRNLIVEVGRPIGDSLRRRPQATRDQAALAKSLIRRYLIYLASPDATSRLNPATPARQLVRCRTVIWTASIIESPGN